MQKNHDTSTYVVVETVIVGASSDSQNCVAVLQASRTWTTISTNKHSTMSTGSTRELPTTEAVWVARRKTLRPEKSCMVEVVNWRRKKSFQTIRARRRGNSPFCPGKV
jgi:hypothetical protein